MVFNVQSYIPITDVPLSSRQNLYVSQKISASILITNRFALPVSGHQPVVDFVYDRKEVLHVKVDGFMFSQCNTNGTKVYWSCAKKWKFKWVILWKQRYPFSNPIIITHLCFRCRAKLRSNAFNNDFTFVDLEHNHAIEQCSARHFPNYSFHKEQERNGH